MTPAELLELAEVRAQVSPISVQQYHTFPEWNENGRRTELIDGVVLEKMSKSPLHTSIALYLQEVLPRMVPPGQHLRMDQPLTLQNSEPEPDAAFAFGSRRDYLTSHPTTAALVIEVAVTSAALDRKKAAIYAAAGVGEYWIVLAEEKKIEVYRIPFQSEYADMTIVGTSAGELSCQAYPEICVSLQKLFE